MNTKNLLKFAKFLESYRGEFSLYNYYLMISILEKYGFKNKKVQHWYLFSQKIFDLKCWLDEWEWCFSFSWEWSKIDLSAIGCATRIRILLDEGLPKNWKKQMLGEEPLNYNPEDLKLIKEIEEVLK